MHPFLQRLVSAGDGIITRCSPAAGALYAIVANHVVQGRIVFPGTGYLEMVRAAGAVALHGAYFLQPLAVEAAGLVVECEVSNGRFEVRSGQESDTVTDLTVHCSGAAASDKVWQRTDHASLRTAPRAADVGALYDGFDALGLQYGPDYRRLVQAWGGESSACSHLRKRGTHEGTQVHPADLDDALCTSALIFASGDSGNETRLPFAVDDALLRGASGGLSAVRARNP